MERMMKRSAILILAGLLVLAFLAGCSRNAPPQWIRGQGSALEVPWEKPGKAFRKAREAALEEARLKIWNKVLPLPFQQEMPETPQDPVLVRQDYLEWETDGATSVSRPLWGSDELTSTSPLAEIEAEWERQSQEAAADRMETVTVEQLAVLDPVFRARLRQMIGNLEPTLLEKEESNRVVIKLQIDKNRVLRLARKHWKKRSRL